jgi:hypothetical protein
VSRRRAHRRLWLLLLSLAVVALAFTVLAVSGGRSVVPLVLLALAALTTQAAELVGGRRTETRE